MLNQTEPKLAKWPFYVGDALLFGTSYFIYFQSKLPMGPWQIFFIVACVAGGAWLGIMPFLLEYRVLVKLAEAKALATVVSQMKNLEGLAAQISRATGQWQQTQEHAGQTAALSKELAERMTGEVPAFTGFMQRANGTEKSALPLGGGQSRP